MVLPICVSFLRSASAKTKHKRERSHLGYRVTPKINATVHAILARTVAFIGERDGFQHSCTPRPTPGRTVGREKSAARSAAPAAARSGAAARRRHARAADLPLQCDRGQH